VANSSISYTDYQRNSRPYSKNLITNQERERTNEVDTVFYRSFFMRHTFLQKFNRQQLQIGADGTFETAGGTTLNQGEKFLNDIGIFVSAEFILGNLKMRPGIRYTFNSVFETIPTPSLNLKYVFSGKLSLRAGYGRGFRAPSIRELYHEFIDSNHNLLGNPELEPEYSHNFNADIAYQLKKNWQLNLAGFYNNINNRITILMPEQADQAWSYTNLNEFKTTGTTLQSDWKYRNVSLQTGFAYTGRFQMLSEEHDHLPDFLFSPEFNQNISYKVPWLKANLSAFYKFTGAFQDYRLVNDQPKMQQIDSFHWLDLTLSKSIGRYLDFTIGARNLLDITAVNNNMTGGVHSGAENGASSVGYGRSFFTRINFKLNTN
jgi:outer membrane receptor for ferrienterochelin and colicins